MSSASRRGADGRDLVFALLLGLALLGCAEALDRWVARRAAASQESQVPVDPVDPVGIVADGHLVLMQAIYGSFVREAAEGGGLRVHNHQTAEPHAPVLARPWEWALGKVLANCGASSEGGVRLERALAIPLTALGLMILFGELFARRALRWGGLVAALLGGSLYWTAVLAGQRSAWSAFATSWLVETHAGLSGLGFALPALLAGVPHLALELAFFGGCVGFALRAARRSSWRAALAAGACGFLLASVRPYTTPVALAAACAPIAWGAWSAARRRIDWKRALVLLACVALPCAPLLVDDWLALRPGSVFAALDVDHPAPPLLQQALFAGLPALVALLWLVPGTWRARQAAGLGDAGLGAALVAWTLANVALVEPGLVAWEVEALLPLLLLVLVVALLALETLPRRALVACGGLLLCLHLVPSGFWLREIAQRARVAGSDLWMGAGEAAALDWLESRRPPDSFSADTPPIVLLAAQRAAALAPWRAGVRVYAGHPDHTVDAAAKAQAAESFYRHGAGLGQLAAAGVTHVLYGPSEARLAGREPGTKLPEHPRLVEVFCVGAVTLYEIAREP